MALASVSPARADLRGSHERLPVESEHGGPRQQRLQRRLVELRLPRQNPRIPAARFADQYPPVVRIEVENPVVAIEGAKEAYAELGALAAWHDLGDAVGLLDLAACGATPVHHLHRVPVRAIRRLGIRNAHGLEAIGKPRDLVPRAVIAIQIDCLYGG